MLLTYDIVYIRRISRSANSHGANFLCLVWNGPLTEYLEVIFDWSKLQTFHLFDSGTECCRMCQKTQPLSLLLVIVSPQAFAQLPYHFGGIIFHVVRFLTRF